jgi:hypothetical protein
MDLRCGFPFIIQTLSGIVKVQNNPGMFSGPQDTFSQHLSVRTIYTQQNKKVLKKSSPYSFDSEFFRCMDQGMIYYPYCILSLYMDSLVNITPTQ